MRDPDRLGRSRCARLAVLLMKTAGMTLIELLVGLAVAGMVAAIAMTSLSVLGLAVVRQRSAMRMHDAVWLAQAAIARELGGSPRWKGCVEARGCSAHMVPAGTPALVLEHTQWLVHDGLRRCHMLCDLYLEGITGIEFIADVPRDDGNVSRKFFAEGHGDKPRALEIVLWTFDGRRHSRTTGRHHHGP